MCAVALFAVLLLVSVSRSLFLFHVCFRAKALYWHGYVRYSIANVVDVFRLSIHFITMLAVAVYCLVFFSILFLLLCFVLSLVSLSCRFSHITHQYVNNIRCVCVFLNFDSLIFLSKCDIAQFYLVIVV